METCGVEVQFSDLKTDICAKFARQKCVECDVPMCDTHTYITTCCDKLLCAGCIVMHECLEKTCALPS